MARIVYVWELGSGLGHLTAAVPLLAHYGSQGHEVWLVCPQISRAARLLPADSPVHMLQAPGWERPQRMPDARLGSYADILWALGFGDTPQLLAMVKAWRALFALLSPDMVIFDHAPTALLAAADAGFRKCTIGTGFTMPPACSPLPPFITHHPAPADGVDNEARVLASINQVASALQAPPFSSLHQMWHVDKALLITWPEIDPYKGRTDADYFGPVRQRNGLGHAVQWPAKTRHALFAYLYGSYANLPEVLALLRDAEADVVAFIPGIAAPLKAQCLGTNIILHEQPLDMHAAMQWCDVVICHAGFGTSWEALLAGRPVLALPQQTEQYLAARDMASLGCCRVLAGRWHAAEAAQSLAALLTEHCRQAAAQIGQRHANDTPQVQLARLAQAAWPG